MPDNGKLVVGHSYPEEAYKGLIGDISPSEQRLTDEEYNRVYRLVPRSCIDGLVTPDYKSVLLIKRDIPPNIGRWCVPGGVIRHGETWEQAVYNKVKRETGLDIKIDTSIGLQGLIQTYNYPYMDRMYWTRRDGFLVVHDPNIFTHTIASAFAARLIGGELTGSAEGREVRFFDLVNLPDEIGFHHKRIIDDFQQLLSKMSVG